MTAPRIAAIIQARMGSTRLPGKTLADLHGNPVIDHVIERVSRAEAIRDTVVAITANVEDDVLAEHLRQLGVSFVRGSSDDVLARYVLAAEFASAEVIVRITADCPLLDPEIIDTVVEAFGGPPVVDYCSNGLRRTYPIGMDVEVFSRAALDRAHQEATLPHEREHVTPYIYQHPELFRLRNVEAPKWAAHPEVRLTLDEELDLQVIREVASHVSPGAGLMEILTTIAVHPEIAAANATVTHRHVGKPIEW